MSSVPPILTLGTLAMLTPMVPVVSFVEPQNVSVGFSFNS